VAGQPLEGDIDAPSTGGLLFGKLQHAAVAALPQGPERAVPMAVTQAFQEIDGRRGTESESGAGAAQQLVTLWGILLQRMVPVSTQHGTLLCKEFYSSPFFAMQIVQLNDAAMAVGRAGVATGAYDVKPSTPHTDTLTPAKSQIDLFTPAKPPLACTDARQPAVALLRGSGLPASALASGSLQKRVSLSSSHGEAIIPRPADNMTMLPEVHRGADHGRLGPSTTPTGNYTADDVLTEARDTWTEVR
jgi:hypothetical protein